MRRVLFESLTLVAIVAISVSTLAGTAMANVPTIVQVENMSTPIGQPASEVEIWVEVTIDHAGPSSTHFVDLIEVDMDGTTKQFVQKQPQTSSPFTVQLFVDRVGIMITPEVRVRAHCNVDGWSGWSSSMTVPEFPFAAIVALVALSVSLFALRRQYPSYRKFWYPAR